MQGVGVACGGAKDTSGAVGNRARASLRRWVGSSIRGFATGAATGGPRPQGRGRRQTQTKIGEPYQLTRWSNTYSGAGGGMSSQCNWDDRPRSRGCTWVYKIVGKLKCPKADTRERQVGVEGSRWPRRGC